MANELHNFFAGQRTTIARSWKALMSHKPLFLYSVLFDLLFLFLAGLVNMVLVKKLTSIMYIIGGLLSKASLDAGAGAGGAPSLFGLLSAARAWGYVAQFAVLFLVWVLGLYFLYCFFHGLSWRLAYGMTGRPRALLAFTKQFFRVNIVWYALFIILNAILFVVSYLTTSIAKKSEVSVHWLWYAPFLLLLYIALVSYSRSEETGTRSNDALRLAWTGKRKLFPAYLLILLLFAVIDIILFGVSYLGQIPLVIVGFLLFVPAFTAARVYWLGWFTKETHKDANKR